MYYVGIDWADEEHYAYITDDSGQKLDSFPMKHSEEGMNRLQNRIHKFSLKLDNVLFSLETDNGLVVSTLMDWGYTVYPINPKAVDRYRDRYKTSGIKSDEFDACVLANILRTDKDRFQPILPDSELSREIKVLTRVREKLIGDRTRLSNRLTSILKAYYPAALELFSEVAQPITLSFLSKYPTYQDARNLSFEEFKRFLSENHYPHSKKARGIYEKLQQPHLECEDMLVRTKSRLMLATVSQLQILMDEIKSYEKEIENLLESHEAVRESAVIALPDADFGEKVTAVVVFNETAPAISPASLIEFCKERLASYKCPKKVFVMDSLPRNAMGKVQKNRLAELLGES